MKSYRVFIGWDSSQLIAWNVAAFSLQRQATVRCDVRRIAMPELRAQGLYLRPTGHADHGYWDEISGAPMSTGHAIARFLVPAICGYEGWALFTDGDVLFRSDISALFSLADESKAIQVVQHQHVPHESIKMDGQAQTAYARKNWSSVVLFNCGHPANKALTVDLVNSVPGRDLHRFCWLDAVCQGCDGRGGPSLSCARCHGCGHIDSGLIGALPSRWNVLIGEEDDPDPAICHYTLGVPDMHGYEHQPFADEWFAAAKSCGYRLERPAKPMAVSA